MMRPIQLFTILAVLQSTTGCAGIYQTARETGECVAQSQKIRHELYFGLEWPDGTEILETDFEDFLNSVLIPLFPEGLTVIDAVGQYKNAVGELNDEPTKVVILVYPDEPVVREHIAEIITSYQSRFDQESVGWVRAAVCASF